MTKRPCPLTFAALVLIGLIVGAAREGRAQDAAFAKANSHYKNGEYEDAIAAYTSILEEGRTSAALHFNLGNSYFRRHQLGLALVSYERARRLQPRDPDIETNLRLARSQLAYTRPGRERVLTQIVRAPFSWVSLDEATAGLLALYLTLMAFLCASAVRPAVQQRLYMPIRTLAVLFILGLSLICVKINSLGREAFVVRRRAEALFAPFDKATTHFELSEGMAVTVVEEKPGWLKVERPDGKAGWIPDAAAVII